MYILCKNLNVNNVMGKALMFLSSDNYELNTLNFFLVPWTHIEHNYPLCNWCLLYGR